MNNDADSDLPLPLEIVDGDAAMDAVFGPEGPTHFTPIGSAMLFWKALLDGRDEHMSDLHNLTYNAAAFGDYSDVEQTLEGYSLMQNVEHPPGHEDAIAYVRFMPDTGHSMRAFGEAEITDYVVLTMVREDEGPAWLVWSYSRNYFPTVKQIAGR